MSGKRAVCAGLWHTGQRAVRTKETMDRCNGNQAVGNGADEKDDCKDQYV